MENKKTHSSGPMENAESILDAMMAERQKFSQKDSDARTNLISQARSLIAALETPMEYILQIIWANPTQYTAIRLALDLKIFETLATDAGRPKTVAQLSVPTGADHNLIARIARHLAATAVICEPQAAKFGPSALSQALTVPKYAGGVKFCFDSSLPTYAQMPSYFAKNSWQNPEDANNGPFQHAHGPGHAFAWLNDRPDTMAAFHAYVYGQREERPSWMDEGFYPVHERLIRGLHLDGDSSALVDVGGGVGYCLEEFRLKVPQWKGRLVLQEQEAVVKQISGLDARIEVMAQDFFKPQPVMGARAYYLRSVLHDWPDERCRDILLQLRNAMKHEYSKILLDENVVADHGASWQHTSLDFYMMALAGAHERTESQWKELLSSVGLEIAGIWIKGDGNQSLIEVVTSGPA
ncbi:MAG: hypothetical protein ASARMPREDX12_009039 [Alectoria sarmentosa]|nr:MAG: hypothetical protein ASARMPREDX12_009039 [Alectoria sarmentosa]